jgi:N-acylneuraminate cytidylyltransferase
VKLLREAGVRVLILSTEQNSVVAQRAAKLGVECLHDVADKGVTLSSWMRANDLDQESVAFLGNDVNDLACLRLVGVPACVADAHPDVRAACRYVTHAAGGEGAVREFAEAILAARSRAGG